MFTRTRAAVKRDNLSLAIEAVNYVKSKMTLGAMNRWEDVKASRGRSVLCWIKIRKFTELGHGIPAVERLAQTAEQLGCGNCGEQTAIALIYLRNRGIRPVEAIGVTNGDHEFAVLGRLKASEINDPFTWGPLAVVCDPWYRKAYRAIEIYSQLPGKSQFTSLLRFE